MVRPRSDNGHKRTLRVVPVAIIGGVMLAILLVVMLGMSVETGRRFRSIEKGWEEYSHAADPRGIWISKIRGYFGYGGLIHNFKNYVLRHDPVYAATLRIQTRNLLQTIDAYLSSVPASDLVERNALLRIRAVVGEYSRNVAIITKDITLGKSAEEIDADVRVDDTAALAALGLLERHWSNRRKNNMAKIMSALSQGEALVRSQAWIMAGLTGLGLLIAGLIYVLMGSALRAHMVELKELEARETAELAERKLGWVVEQSPASILITDTRGKIEYVNHKFLDITGYGRDEVIGHTPALLKSGHTPEAAYRAIWERLAKGEPWRGVFKNLRKDGSAYWAETQLLPLLDKTGKITNFIGIGEDITEKRHVDQQIAQVQKMEAVGILAGSVAHDFNNVLMTIIGNVELIRLEAEDLAAPDSLLVSVHHIELAARRARALIQQLLTFARQQPGRPQRLNLHTAISEALELIRVSTPPTIQLDYHHGATDLATEMDPTALFQIIMNLCQNAAEAIADKGGAITLNLERIAPGGAGGLDDLPRGALGTLRLRVCDTGPGIPERLLAQVFEPFFSTKPVGKGTGLGLAIVRNWVEEAHGQVSVKSTPGKGTCFTLSLPQFTDVDAAHVKPAGLVRGNEHILLVDDEETLLYTIRRMLARLGYQVEAYGDPVLALRAFENAPDSFDAVVTDFMMPHMSGTDLITALRAKRDDFPALLISSYLSDSDVPKSLGFIMCADKPVGLSTLANALRQTLDTPVIDA